MKQQSRVLGSFRVPVGGHAPPGRYTLTESGWVGPCDATVKLLNEHFPPHHPDAVSASAIHFGTAARRVLRATSAA